MFMTKFGGGLSEVRENLPNLVLNIPDLVGKLLPSLVCSRQSLVGRHWTDRHMFNVYCTAHTIHSVDCHTGIEHGCMNWYVMGWPSISIGIYFIYSQFIGIFILFTFTALSLITYNMCLLCVPLSDYLYVLSIQEFNIALICKSV